MNLIRDAWIPVRRLSGETSVAAPWQLTEGIQIDPITALSSTRADFDGALIQFLIGLLQTAAAPRDHDEWLERLEMPPSAGDLRNLLDPYASAFELHGVGPCFMQEGDLDCADSKGIAGLLIDSPGDNTLVNNVDHFVKRGRVEALCAACTAAALFCLQTNAPAGGVGYRTSIRGGGPLTTLVVADHHSDPADQPVTLWRNCWLNVLDADTLGRQSGNTALAGIATALPWMALARTGEMDVPTTPMDVHPLHMYWGMPRRIRLLPPSALEPRPCDLCSREAAQLFTRYITKNYGINYQGNWRHPLSPYDIDTNGAPVPVHPQAGGISYRHWLGIIQAIEAKRSRREPAAVVQLFRARRAGDIHGQFRIWAFGYDMKNAKARCWYESTMPLYDVAAADRGSFECNVAKLIFAAREISSHLRQALKKAWFRRPQEKSEATAFVTEIFWQRTEHGFYACMKELQSMSSDAEAARDMHAIWLRYLREEAESLFDQWAWAGPIEDSDLRRIGVSRRELERFNCSNQLTEEVALALKNPVQR